MMRTSSPEEITAGGHILSVLFCVSIQSVTHSIPLPRLNALGDANEINKHLIEPKAERLTLNIAIIN